MDTRWTAARVKELSYLRTRKLNSFLSFVQLTNLDKLFTKTGALTDKLISSIFPTNRPLLLLFDSSIFLTSN